MSQFDYIFPDTFENNITFYSEKKIELYENLIRMMNLESLRDKFEANETNMQEEGSNLSGGQIQRIILARTLYSSNNLIILDEPLTNVEKSLEEKIIKNLFNFVKLNNKTLVMTSHSKTGFDLSDNIIIIEDSKNIVNGSHEELIAKNEYYKKNYS